MAEDVSALAVSPLPRIWDGMSSSLTIPYFHGIPVSPPLSYASFGAQSGVIADMISSSSGFQNQLRMPIFLQLSVPLSLPLGRRRLLPALFGCRRPPGSAWWVTAGPPLETGSPWNMDFPAYRWIMTRRRVSGSSSSDFRSAPLLSALARQPPDHGHRSRAAHFQESLDPTAQSGTCRRLLPESLSPCHL
jgi:hypothetical protein